MAELIVRSGVPEPGVRWPVRSPRVTMGSAHLPGVPRVAESAAGCRAELLLHDGVWVVADHGSDALRVDGEPLVGAAPLAPGSTIRCGELEAVFLPHDRWSPTETPEAPTVEAVPSAPVAPPVEAPRAPTAMQAPLFAAMPASAPRRVPAWLILTLVAAAAIAVAAFFILRSR